MTTQEFNSQFEVLYNYVRSGSAPGIDEYEKSLFLTKAQEEIVKNHFNPKSLGNNLQEGFNQSEKRDIEFSNLIKVEDITSSQPSISYTGIDERSEFFIYPSDVLLVLNEQIYTDRKISVVPLNYKEYDRLMQKPYSEPLKRQAWRVLQSNIESDNLVSEIIVKTGTTISSYKIRYVKRPQPIIVDDISPESIQGISTVSECELDPIIHQEILDRAIQLAKLHFESMDLNTMVQLNQRNE